MTTEIKTPAVLDKNNMATTAGWVTVFNIHPDSREYLSSVEEYLAEGVGIPADAYLDKPLKSKKGFAVLRSADRGVWEYQPDHRGEIRYSTAAGTVVTVSEMGDYPAHTTDIAPNSSFDKWDGVKWVADKNMIAALARRHRDAFIKTTDSITVIDYSIDDSPLTDTQRAELTATRAAYRAWPTVENWPQVELPELPQWLLIEAVNQGYIVPDWPPVV